jgi:hypothetical protein
MKIYPESSQGNLENIRFTQKVARVSGKLENIKIYQVSS